jgi:prepilin-type N-terminal cleavage/methylation domain-containing protein
LSWRRQQLGFTVLELLVVLTIIAIISLLVVPSFLSFIEEFHVTSVGEDLLYNLQYARSEAIKRNTNIYVTFNTTDPWCYGINVGATCACSSAGNCTLGAFAITKTQSEVMTTKGLSGGSIIFEGTRGATTNGASEIIFTIYGQTTAMGVSVTQIGDMTMCSSTIAGYTACP